MRVVIFLDHVPPLTRSRKKGALKFSHLLERDRLLCYLLRCVVEIAVSNVLQKEMACSDTADGERDSCKS